MRYKVLSIIDSLNPKDGGPSHSLFDMALSNKQNNIQHDILYIGKKQKINDLSGIKIISLNDSIFKYGISLRLIFWLYQNKNNYNLFIMVILVLEGLAYSTRTKPLSNITLTHCYYW